jgi:hypothetical protein
LQPLQTHKFRSAWLQPMFCSLRRLLNE